MARNDDRNRRDLAGVGPDPDYVAGDLASLRELKDFQIGAGEPDIRGWDVTTLTGQSVGTVDDLLVDTRRGQVVLLDVDLREQRGHADVPIRAVQLDRARRCVIVDSTDMQSFRGRTVDNRLSRAEERLTAAEDRIDTDERRREQLLRDEIRRDELRRDEIRSRELRDYENELLNDDDRVR
jgi:hypothetical protein